MGSILIIYLTYCLLPHNWWKPAPSDTLWLTVVIGERMFNYDLYVQNGLIQEFRLLRKKMKLVPKITPVFCHL